MTDDERVPIRQVTDAGDESLVDLLCELHAFYAARPRSRAEIRAHLTDNLLAAGSPLRLFVAQRPDGRAVGLAAVVLVHSVVEPGERQCHLKELFVTATHRNGGVGAALMRWVAAYAIEHGCGRLDWNVRAGNQKGLAFYERLGGTRVADRLSYRMSRAALRRLAMPPDPG